MSILLRTRHNSSGFTLLEIVIAMAILSFSLVALLSATNRALIMNASATRLTDAVFLATLSSYGSDGEEGGEDNYADINSWELE